MLHILTAVVSVAMIVVVLVDGFEAMVLPRRVTHRLRPARLFYRSAWQVWRNASRMFRTSRRREAFLSWFGPLSLLTLLSLWVSTLITGFGLLNWSLGATLSPAAAGESLANYLYLSGVTLLTLGYGDITATNPLGRLLAVVETMSGFGFIAIIIGYFPVLYQAFSARERTIALLDARAGSPPTAGELLRRLAEAGKLGSADEFLQEWERWSADLLESQLSFQVLAYYRSQHDNQSWLAALTAILDTCALLMAVLREQCSYQAQLTFAISRHAAVDLALVFWIPPTEIAYERAQPEKLTALVQKLTAAGYQIDDLATVEQRLNGLRELYEPFLFGLSEYFVFPLPPFSHDKVVVDNWQSSAWMKRSPGIGNLAEIDHGHFG
jgi:hypothetical protein